MKKIISLTLMSILLVMSFMIPVCAADVSEEDTEIAADSIIEIVTGIYDNDDVQALSSSDLILSKALTLTKTTNGLVIKAKTQCISDVTKCGFTYIKLQRLINGTWTDYSAYCYKDQYIDSCSMSFSKTVTPPKGYTYRLICEHYAEKKKLIFFKDTQTIYNATSSLAY